jgi:hypothetical protein
MGVPGKDAKKCRVGIGSRNYKPVLFLRVLDIEEE